MRRRTGFSLMELLVIIIIVGMLAAMLFPVFSQARNADRTSTSATEFKRNGQAVLMYAQDYDEMLPYRPVNTAPAGFRPLGKRKAALADTCTLLNPNSPDQWQSLNGGCQEMQANLVWSRTSDEATGFYNRVYTRAPGDLRLPGGKDYCRDLVEGGFDDWRLPTKDEAAIAANHQMSSYVSMRYPDTWTRWAGPDFYKGKDLYAYVTKLGTGTSTAVVVLDRKGNYPIATDTICVRTP